MPCPPPDRSAVRSLALLAVVAAWGCGPAPAPAAAPVADAPDPARAAALGDTLVGLVTAAYDFSRPDVVARLLALYPAEGPLVSAAGGRVVTSRAALGVEFTRFWTRVGQNMRGARFVVGERHVTVLGPDAAVLTVTYAIPHDTPEGRPHTLAGAWTAVFQRRGGRWLIVQEHLSDVPPAR